MLGHSLGVLGESAEGGVDHVDEIVSGIAVLEATGNTVLVHLRDKGLELVAGQPSVLVLVATNKGSVDLAHEQGKCIGVSPEGFLKH